MTQRQYRKPLPAPTPDTKPYWDALKQHTLRMPRCRDCGRFHHFPRVLCPYCGSTDLEWRTLTGQGRLYAYCVNYRPPPGWDNESAPVVAIVELEEGPKVTTDLVDAPSDPTHIRIGTPVEPVFDDVTPEVTLLRFRLAQPRMAMRPPAAPGR